jgi:Polyketide cyclase / dehydrase and lipid transport
MEKRPEWRKAERFERKAIFKIPARPEKVFPLLCPVLEYDWIPDWRCTMLYSESGVAEKDAAFFRHEAPGVKAFWYCVAYEPPERIEYLVLQRRGTLMKLSLSLEEAEGGSTRLTWTMLFTTSGWMAFLLKRRFSPELFEKFIALRKRQLEEYFARLEA